ncbi:MAG: exonuclease SbcCD subunit D [Actinomycetota bacterium]|nr:exonuclease SbcCD subunit D [Actinomycetota bacterium]
MKLIHTSDWHLGRTLHGESLLEYQRNFLDWLTALAVDREVDAVLVAGDVYDRAIPTTDAVQLLDDVLVGMARAGVTAVLTSGNHDSAIRLGFGSGLQQAAGIHIRTRVADLATPVVLRDEAGEVALYGIPYLLPDAVSEELAAQRSHESVLRAAVERVLQDAAARSITRTVALSHAFVTGARPCDSERDIRVGGIGDAPAAVFDGITFTALGHLHAQQSINDRVAYSGSPLAFSFSERHHAKSVSLVEIGADAAVRVQTVPVPPHRPLRQVRGRIDELLRRADADLADVADAWVKAIITDPTRPRAPMERLRERWPNTLVLDFQPEGPSLGDMDHQSRLPDATAPVEICSAFVEWVDSTRPTRAQCETFQTAIEAVARAELSA